MTCLTPDTDSDYHVAVSPDGRTLLFTTHRDGVRSLYLMNADGTDQRRLTAESDAGLAQVAGREAFVFSSNRDGRYCIYVMKADGTHARRLTNGPSDDCPRGLPMGAQSRMRGCPRNVAAVVNAGALAGDEPDKTEAGEAEITSDRWDVSGGRNGRRPGRGKISFTTSTRAGQRRHLRDARRRRWEDERQITTNPAQDVQPAWRGAAGALR